MPKLADKYNEGHCVHGIPLKYTCSFCIAFNEKKSSDAFKDEIKVALKSDTNKARFDLIPPEPLEALAELYAIGAAKYGDRNWEQGFKWGRVFAALMRHAWAWWRGERLDPVDGQNHMIAVAWNAFTLYYHELHNLGEDDRSKLNNKNFEEKSSSLFKEELTEILESMSRE